MVCKCGCGQEVTARPYWDKHGKHYPKYILGHCGRPKLYLSKVLCKCGCGQELSYKSKRQLKQNAKYCKEVGFIRGHQFRGYRHHSWNGGKSITYHGYIDIYMPEHPFASQRGYVREHRLVMEKHLGRYLLSHESIHHINGIPNDNRIENLVVLTRSGHGFYHSPNKFSPEEVLNIRQRLSSGEKAFRIAKNLGVYHSRIYGIKNGKSYI